MVLPVVHEAFCITGVFFLTSHLPVVHEALCITGVFSLTSHLAKFCMLLNMTSHVHRVGGAFATYRTVVREFALVLCQVALQAVLLCVLAAANVALVWSQSLKTIERHLLQCSYPFFLQEKKMMVGPISMQSSERHPLTE